MKKQIPFDFVLDELSKVELNTKPMFGCTGVYVGSKIVLILRKKEVMDEDTGIWLCIPDEHVTEVKLQYPFLKGVSFFENPNTGWQVLHESHPEFEEMTMEFCARIKKGDPMIGRVPKEKKSKKPSKKRATALKRTTAMKKWEIKRTKKR